MGLIADLFERFNREMVAVDDEDNVTSCVATFDAGDGFFAMPEYPQIVAWEREHGIDTWRVYRVEVYRIPAKHSGGVYGYAMVYAFEPGEDGERYIVRPDGDPHRAHVARAKPYTVRLYSPPPVPALLEDEAARPHVDSGGFTVERTPCDCPDGPCDWVHRSRTGRPKETV